MSERKRPPMGKEQKMMATRRKQAEAEPANRTVVVWKRIPDDLAVAKAHRILEIVAKALRRQREQRMQESKLAVSREGVDLTVMP